MKAGIKAVPVDTVSLSKLFTVNSRTVTTVATVLSLSLLAFLISLYQVLGESPDYGNYEQFFDALREYGLNVTAMFRFEPGFVLAAFGLVTLFASNSMVFSVMVAGSVLLKAFVVHLFSAGRGIVFIVALFYFARYLPLHELTQIRASLAAAFLLLAASFIRNDRRVRGVLACFLAATFHLSAIVAAPVLFLRSSRRSAVVLIAAAVFLGVYVSGEIFINALEERLNVVAMYQAEGFGEPPNPLSSALVLDWAMIAAGFVMWHALSSPMKNVLLLQLIGMAVFYAAMDFPVIAHRIRELISVFWLIYVSEGLQLEEAVKTACVVFVAASIALYSYLYIFDGRLFL